MPTSLQPPSDMTTLPLAISAALYQVGFTTRSSQARLVGEDPTQWSRYLSTWRSPQVKKVGDWVAAAAAQGYTLRIQWDVSGCTAECSRLQPPDTN